MVQPIKNVLPPTLTQKTLPAVSPDNRKAIHNLFKELATGSLWELTKNSFQLSSVGAKLKRELHPFQMIT
jgi:hypothetical protein